MYFATIDWGDGSPNALPATISGWSVTGSHTYSEEGAYTVTITLRDSDTPYNYAIVQMRVFRLRSSTIPVTRHKSA